MANYKLSSVTLPQCFGEKPYFELAYKKRSTELVNRTYEVGYLELKLLYPSEEFNWQISKFIKIVCKINPTLASEIVGFNTYYKPKFKIKCFRILTNLVCTDRTLQLQTYFTYLNYHVKEITAIRHRFKALLEENYTSISSAEFFESAITTDTKNMFMTLKGEYPHLKMFLITKCKIV